MVNEVLLTHIPIMVVIEGLECIILPRTGSEGMILYLLQDAHQLRWEGGSCRTQPQVAVVERLCGYALRHGCRCELYQRLRTVGLWAFVAPGST